MHSPPNPDSPISTSSSLSEAEDQPNQPAATSSILTPASRTAPRRQGTAGSTTGPVRRSERERDRERQNSRGVPERSGSLGLGGQGAQGLGKEELVDVQVADVLRKGTCADFDSG